LDEFGALGSEDEVTSEGDIGACPGRDAIDPGDDRLGQRGEGPDGRVPGFLDGFAKIHGLSGRDGAIVEVLSGAKAAARPGQDDNARIAQVTESVAQFAMHATREAVQAIRTVERDPRDSVRARNRNVLVAHAPLLARPLSK